MFIHDGYSDCLLVIVCKSKVVSKIALFLLKKKIISMIFARAVESTVQTAISVVWLFNCMKDEVEGIQVYINGTWGNMCRNKFLRNKAAVVCHQLGFGQVLDFYMAGSRTGYDIN